MKITGYKYVNNYEIYFVLSKFLSKFFSKFLGVIKDYDQG